MELLPIKTRRIEPGDDLVEVLNGGIKVSGIRYQVSGIQESDILVISSKAIATAEGRIVNLSLLLPSEEAKKFAEKCGRSPEFCEAVLEETKMRNGTVRGTCPGAMITELRPWGASIRLVRVTLSSPSRSEGVSKGGRGGATQHDTMGTIITANAGLDESNTAKGTAVGWPEDPVKSARRLRKALGVPVIITDSCVRPRRWGVVAFALAVAGIDPLRDEEGRKDLFGRKLRITKEAIADQLATAANMLMGNAEQSIPAVIVRDHGLMLSEYEGWVPGINPEEDLFRGIV